MSVHKAAMTDISLDRTRFRLLLAKGEIIVFVRPDSYTGPLRDIDVSGWWPGMTETLQRIYDLPLPASSLDPLVDQYVSSAASLGGWYKIESFIDDERLERWGWSSDKEAMRLHGERAKEASA